MYIFTIKTEFHIADTHLYFQSSYHLVTDPVLWAVAIDIWTVSRCLRAVAHDTWAVDGKLRAVSPDIHAVNRGVRAV